MSLIEACRELTGIEIECAESMYMNFKITEDNINVLKYFMPVKWHGEFWHNVCGIYLGMGVHLYLYYNGHGKIVKVFGTLDDRSTIVDTYNFDSVTRMVTKDCPHPVVSAILLGQYASVHEMLHSGMDPNLVTEHGKPVMLAIKHNRIRMLRDFIRWGGEFREKEVMEAALSSRNIEIVRVLVEMGYDLSLDMIEFVMHLKH